MRKGMVRSEKIRDIKKYLLGELKREGVFWSYEEKSVNVDTLGDDRLIASVMRYLDLDAIKQLFTVFSASRIRKAWLDLLVPEGDYLRTLNRFFAWYYFDVKNPDSYLRSMEARHIHRLLK